MIDVLEFAALAQLPEPLLTVYLNTNPGLQINCRAIPGYIAWLKTGARGLLAQFGETKSSLLYAQVLRAEKYLEEQRPAYAGVAIFASAEVWRVIPLEVEPANEIHWGKPQLWQLTAMVEQHRPACAVVLDLSGARFYARDFGGLRQFAKQEFDVDVSQWKPKERAHMAKQGTRMPHGAQRDLFEQRLEGEYAHLLQDVAKTLTAYCDAHAVERIYLLGADRLTKQVQRDLPARLREQAICISHVSADEPESKTRARVEAELKKSEVERKEHLVEELLDKTRGIATGVDQTLAQLQRGLLTTLVLSAGLNPSLRVCETCDLVTTSPMARCATCNEAQATTTLHEVLPTLLAKHACRLEVVDGRAAVRLQSVGGMGGVLRTLKHEPVPPPARHVQHYAHA